MTDLALRTGFFGLLLLTAGCNAGLGPASQVATPVSAAAELRDRAGLTKAAAIATQVGRAIRLQVSASGLPSGAYGIHIHAVGRCEAPGFESAGPHWNPTGRQHGKQNPRGMHKGDLPNLLIGSDRRGSVEVRIPDASLGGGTHRLLDADGAAVVLHAAADDYLTDPSGNSGARIACGIFR